MAKTEIRKWLEAKDDLIQHLRRQLAQQEEAHQQTKQNMELEEYVCIQEAYFAEQMAEKELFLTKLNKVHDQEKGEWAYANAELQRSTWLCINGACHTIYTQTD